MRALPNAVSRGTRSSVPLLFVAACTIDVDVGDLCPEARISEVMLANHTVDVPVGDGLRADYLEVVVSGDTVVDLADTVVLRNAPNLGSVLEGPLLLAPGERLLLIASSYQGSDAFVPGDPRVLVRWLNLDFNNDGDEFEWLGPGPTHPTCQHLIVPDQHNDMSWRPFPVEGGCYTRPSPGEEDYPCFCAETGSEC